MSAVRHFLVNVFCAFIPNKPLRKKMRVMLNSDVNGCVRFIKHDLNKKKIGHIKFFVGYQARSLIVSVNNEYVYKFPLRRKDADKLAVREKRIVDALSKISPIRVPGVELLKWNEKIVRKYEHISGVTLSQMKSDDVINHIDVLAPKIAKFIYDIACVDPKEIRDLKPSASARPGYCLGWYQGDIADNFIIDPETFDVVAFIDWEDARFCDFSWIFTAEKRSPRRELMMAVGTEYDKLYNKNNCKK